MNFLTKLATGAIVACGTYGAIYYGHQSFVPDYDGKEVLTGKTVLITGATSGIGKATAIQLAKRNAKIILGCRDQDKCIWVRREIAEKTKNEQIYCSVLDLASLQSINEFVQRMKSKDIHFDILINNAGVMRCPLTYTKEGFEMQLGVNHLGHFYLTHILMEDLVKHKARIINVTAEAYKKGKINLDDLNSATDYNPTYAYNQSKLANILFTKELAERLQGSGVYAYAVDPGVCNTSITRHMKIDKSITGKIFARPFLKMLGRSPEKGAQVIMYCALSPELANEDANGKMYRDNKRVDPQPHAKDDLMAKKLWLVSDRWTVNRDKPSNSSVALSSPQPGSQPEPQSESKPEVQSEPEKGPFQSASHM